MQGVRSDGAKRGRIDLPSRPDPERVCRGGHLRESRRDAARNRTAFLQSTHRPSPLSQTPSCTYLSVRRRDHLPARSKAEQMSAVRRGNALPARPLQELLPHLRWGLVVPPRPGEEQMQGGGLAHTLCTSLDQPLDTSPILLHPRFSPVRRVGHLLPWPAEERVPGVRWRIDLPPRPRAAPVLRVRWQVDVVSTTVPWHNPQPSPNC